MVSKQTFRTAVWADKFAGNYGILPADKQRGCDMAVMALIKGESSVGLRVKPIHPDKYYFEARINSGDRIVFRVEGSTIYFIDIVDHDSIDRYSRRPKVIR